MRPRCRWISAILGAFLVEIAHGGTAAAGEVFGRATSAAGSPLPGVVVSIDGPSLASARSARTADSGAYRLAAIPPGVYRLTFEMEGFARAERSDVEIGASFHARIDVVLNPAGGRDVVALTSGGPLLDTASTSLTVAWGRGAIDLLPLARGNWGVLGALPGVRPVLDDAAPRSVAFAATEDAAAAEAHGRVWVLDDGLVGAGSLRAPFDYGLGSLEEVGFERGSGDASVRHGGAGTVRIVTRSGTNRFAGTGRYDISDWRLQSDNLTPALKEQGAGLGSRVQQITGIEIGAGGPIVPRKAWAWASVSSTRTAIGIIGFYAPACLEPDGSPTPGARVRTECLVPDVTTVRSGSAKVQYQWPAGARSTLLWARSSRTRPNRGASAFDRPESTNRQHSLGTARPLQFQQQWMPSDRLVVDAGYSFTDAGFVLDFQYPGLAGVQPAYDRYTLINSRSGASSRQLRQTTHVLATANVFVPRPAGNHAITCGLELLDAHQRRYDRTGGGAVAVFDTRSGTRQPWQARVIRDGEVSHEAREWSAVVQESYQRGVVSLNAGVRFDRQDDRAGAASIPASDVLPGLLPAVRFAGADSGVVYDDISPRAGFIWNLRGRGTTVVKVAAARHHAAGNATSSVLQPTGQTRLVYWWNDADGDTFVRSEELALVRGFAATPTSNYDAANPTAVRTPARVDPALLNIRSDEASIGLEQQVRKGLALRVSYVVRKVYRLQSSYPTEADGSPVSSRSYYPVAWMPGGCPPGARCPAVTYYQRDAALPPGTLLRNDGRYEWQHRADVVVHRRLSDGWMLDLALTWNRSATHFPLATRDYTDPTNVSSWEGTEYGSPEPRWQVKASGSVRLPARFGTAAVLAGDRGLPYDRVVATPDRGALGATRVSIQRYGTERYPDAWRLDWRLDWKVERGRVKVVPTLNVFNALNANAVLARNRVQNSQGANQVVGIMAPRVLRLDLVVSW